MLDLVDGELTVSISIELPLTQLVTVKPGCGLLLA